ncbi:hypothetical protein M758_7G047400 [Ceratodon purpureus]|nr:hypothetical protein M758_7G047400 [Ceratodon purpureus]
MQVMEAAAQSQPSQPPCAELVGLQFGLATHDDYVGFSVLEKRRKGQPRDELNSLKDPRLGIPVTDDICATCGGINYHECTGHFGHLELTQPIYHPNHVPLLQRILQKTCLACGLPRLKKKGQGTPAGTDVLNADVTQTTTSSRRPCKHCSPGYPDYRSILVKILPVKGRKKDDVAQTLVLEVQGADREDEFRLPNDFWVNITGADPLDDEPAVPKRHFLSASEALKILRKIPESAIGKLGMNGLVARPEGLVMKCVPVPPNCIRIAEHKFPDHMAEVRFGSDRVTRTLQNLLTEIKRNHRTRGGTATQRAKRDESRALQILTAEYLREKGAPKKRFFYLQIEIRSIKNSQ